MRTDSFHPSPSLSRPHVAVVLLQSSDALVPHPPGDKEGFGDIRGKAFDEYAGDKPHQDQFRIPLKHADARVERRKVEPLRWSFRILEESSQGSRSAFKGLRIPIHPRLDESSLLLRGQQGEVVRQLFGQRVSDDSPGGPTLALATKMNMDGQPCGRPPYV